MKKFWFLAFGFSMALASPSLGQVIRPQMTPPPCTGHNCVNRQRGAQVIPGADPAHRALCPHGTRFDARKGTCKVFATH